VTGWSPATATEAASSSAATYARVTAAKRLPLLAVGWSATPPARVAPWCGRTGPGRVAFEMRFRWLDCELDREARTLVRGQSPVRAQSLVVDLLLLLIAQRGRVVSEERLRRELWPGVQSRTPRCAACEGGAAHDRRRRRATGADTDGAGPRDPLRGRGHDRGRLGHCIRGPNGSGALDQKLEEVRSGSRCTG
jgi:hypothetical protein